MQKKSAIDLVVEAAEEFNLEKGVWPDVTRAILITRKATEILRSHLVELTQDKRKFLNSNFSAEEAEILSQLVEGE